MILRLSIHGDEIRRDHGPLVYYILLSLPPWSQKCWSVEILKCWDVAALKPAICDIKEISRYRMEWNDYIFIWLSLRDLFVNQVIIVYKKWAELLLGSITVPKNRNDGKMERTIFMELRGQRKKSCWWYWLETVLSNYKRKHGINFYKMALLREAPRQNKEPEFKLPIGSVVEFLDEAPCLVATRALASNGQTESFLSKSYWLNENNDTCWALLPCCVNLYLSRQIYTLFAMTFPRGALVEDHWSGALIT